MTSRDEERQAVYLKIEQALAAARKADANPEGPDFVTALGDILFPPPPTRTRPIVGGCSGCGHPLGEVTNGTARLRSCRTTDCPGNLQQAYSWSWVE